MTDFVSFFTFIFGIVAGGHLLAAIGGIADHAKFPAGYVVSGMLALGLTIWGVTILGAAA